MAAVPDAVLRGVAVDNERRVRPGDDGGRAAEEFRAERRVADVDRVAADPDAAVLRRVVAEDGQGRGRPDERVAAHGHGRRQRGAGQRHGRGGEGRDGPGAGEAGDPDLLAEVEPVGEEGAAVRPDERARVDLHRLVQGDGLERLGDVDGALDDARVRRERAGREVHDAAGAAAWEAVGERAGAVPEARDPSRADHAADLDVIADLVAGRAPAQAVGAGDRGRGRRGLDQPGHRPVAPAVDDRQAAVPVGHEDGPARRHGRAGRQPDAAEVEDVVARARHADEPPGIRLQATDHDLLADHEPGGLPVEARARDVDADRAGRQRDRAGRVDRRIGRGDRAEGRARGEGRAGQEHGGVIEREVGDGPRPDQAGDRHGLAGEEAERRPVEAGTHDRRADAAVTRDRADEVIGQRDRVRRSHRGRRVQRALDVEPVVALAEEQVQDLDRALAAVGFELAVDEGERAEADAAGEGRRLAPALGDRAGEGEVLGHPEAAQRRLGHDAGAVLVAGVVVDVEDVDGAALGRLRTDRDQVRVRLARHVNPVLQRAVGARDAALDGERSAQPRQLVERGREDLDALPGDRQRVRRVRVQVDRLLRVPVRRGERRLRGGPADPDARRGEVRPAGQERALARELELVVLRLVDPADDRDLEVGARRGVALVRADPDALALEEALTQEAPDLAAGGQRQDHLADAAAVEELDGALEQPAAGEPADRRARVGAGGPGEPGRERHRVLGRRGDDAVVARAPERDPDLVADREALLDEAAELAPVRAGEHEAGDRQVALEEPRRDVAADRRHRGRRDRGARHGDDVHEPVGQDRDRDVGGRPLGQPQRVVIVRATELDERLALTLDRHDARRIVVIHLDVEEAGAGPQVRELVILAVTAPGLRAAHERQDRGLEILGLGVVARIDLDPDRVVPLAARERQQVLGAADDREAARGAGELDRLGGLGVERDLDDHGLTRGELHSQLDEELVGEPGVVGCQAEAGVRRALDDDRPAVLDRRARLDLGDDDARRVVVADLDLDVPDGNAVDALVRGHDRVLDDDDPLALGARVELRRRRARRRRVLAGLVDGPHVHVLRVVRGEGEDEGPVRALVDRHEDAVPDDVADVLGKRVAVGVVAREAPAQPDRVALAVGQRVGVEVLAVGLLLRRARRRDRHVDRRGDRVAGGDLDRIAVDRPDRAVQARQAVLAHGGEPVGLANDHGTRARGGDVEVDPVGRQTLVVHVAGRHEMVDRAADALELAGDDVLHDVAGDVDRVGAEAADHPVRDAERGRLDEELVVTLEAVHLDDLDRREADVEARAIDALGRDDDVVGELGAKDDELVDARAAVDGDRGVDVVLDLVVAAAGPDVEGPPDREAEADDRRRGVVHRVERDGVVLPLVRRGRGVGVGLVADAVAVVVPAARQRVPALAGEGQVLGIGANAVRVRVDGVEAGDRVGFDVDVAVAAPGDEVRIRVADRRQGEGADDEQVGVVVALQAELSLVRVDDELVVARAALGDQRGVRAWAQPAARRRDEDREDVLRQDRALRLVAPAAEDLADLERVEARPAVQADDRRRVVRVEVVVAGQAEDAQPPIETGVVVDPLDVRVRARRRVGRAVVAVVGEVAVEERDEGGPVRVLAGRLAGRRDAEERVRDPTAALGVDALARPEQEQVVVRVADRVGRLGVAVEVRVCVVDAVDRRLVRAVFRGARVEQVDDVVADRGGDRPAAGRVDRVEVGVRLAVEGQRVAGTDGGRGLDVHRLQVPDDEAVLAVVAGGEGLAVHADGRLDAAAVDARLGAELDVAIVVRGRGRETVVVAELEGVDVRVPEDPGLLCRGRSGLERARAERELRARGDDAVGGNPAAEDDRRAVVRIGVAGAGRVEAERLVAVAVDVDVAGREDLAVRVRRDVVADAQQHGTRLGEDRRLRDVAVVVGAALGKEHRAGAEQVQVLVVLGRLADGHPDGACVRVREDEVEGLVDLGDEDARARLQADVARRVKLVAGVGVGAADRAGAEGVDLEIVRARGRADRAAVRVEVDRLAEDVGETVLDAAAAHPGVDDRAVDRTERNVGVGRDRVDLQGQVRFADEDAERVRRARIERVEDAERDSLEDVDVDLEPVRRDADAALGTGQAGMHRDADAAHVRTRGRGVDRQRGDRVRGRLRIVLGIHDAVRRPEPDVGRGRGDVPDAQVAGRRALLRVDEPVREQDQLAIEVRVRVRVRHRRERDEAGREVADRDVVPCLEVVGARRAVARGRIAAQIEVGVGTREQVVARDGARPGRERGELVVRARRGAMLRQRAVGPEEPVPRVLAEVGRAAVRVTVHMDAVRAAGGRAVEAVTDVDVDVGAGVDGPERDHERVGSGAGRVRMPVRRRVEDDVVAGIGGDDDVPRVERRLADGVRALCHAPLRIAGGRHAVLGVVALDELHVDRHAQRRVAVGRAEADRAQRRIEIQDVRADELRRDGIRALDVATVRADPGRADRVVDRAREDDVPVCPARLQVPDLDERGCIRVDDLEVERPAEVDIRAAEHDRGGVVVRHAVLASGVGRVLDVDLDLRGGRRPHHVDRVDDDVVIGVVADLDVIPALLEVEDRGVAPDLGLRPVQADVVRIEQGVARGVVDDRIEDDRPGTADRAAEDERAAVTVRAGHVDERHDLAGRVDPDLGVRLTQQDGRRFPVDLPLDHLRLGPADATAIEPTTALVALAGDDQPVGERVHLEVRGPDDRVLLAGDARGRLGVIGRVRVRVPAQAIAVGRGVGRDLELALLRRELDERRPVQLGGAAKDDLRQAAGDRVGSRVRIGTEGVGVGLAVRMGPCVGVRLDIDGGAGQPSGRADVDGGAAPVEADPRTLAVRVVGIAVRPEAVRVGLGGDLGVDDGLGVDVQRPPRRQRAADDDDAGPVRVGARAHGHARAKARLVRRRGPAGLAPRRCTDGQRPRGGQRRAAGDGHRAVVDDGRVCLRLAQRDESDPVAGGGRVDVQPGLGEDLERRRPEVRAAGDRDVHARRSRLAGVDDRVVVVVDPVRRARRRLRVADVDEPAARARGGGNRLAVARRRAGEGRGTADPVEPPAAPGREIEGQELCPCPGRGQVDALEGEDVAAPGQTGHADPEGAAIDRRADLEPGAAHGLDEVDLLVVQPADRGARLVDDGVLDDDARVRLVRRQGDRHHRPGREAAFSVSIVAAHAGLAALAVPVLAE